MKILLATAAIVAAAGSPALAQAPSHYSFPQRPSAPPYRAYAPPHRAYASPYRAYAFPYRAYASPYRAYAFRPYLPNHGYYIYPPDNHPHSPNPAWDVYDTRGRYVGSDPDPFIRSYLARRSGKS
jgi:hypothetical protein